MVVVIKKWGNSLGVRIPKIMAKDLNLKDGTSVEIEDKGGIITISPAKNSLAELLNGIDESNIHHETDFGVSTGKETW